MSSVIARGSASTTSSYINNEIAQTAARLDYCAVSAFARHSCRYQTSPHFAALVKKRANGLYSSAIVRTIYSHERQHVSLFDF